MIKIVTPTVDKAAAKIFLPGAFWDLHQAGWLDVAFCGRPSDFLHETVLCSTTTRALIEQSLRDIGCHDGDAWTDSARDFRNIRGDRLLITVQFTLDGKPQNYALDEPMTLQTDDISWGGALGLPWGFMFKGDPDHSRTAALQAAPATSPETAVTAPADSDDAGKILLDDPQIALNFKGIQSASQSFADHPLAMDDWPVDTLRCGRNYAVLAKKVFDSNGDIPVTITMQKVTEEQLLNEDAKLWHDSAQRDYMLARLPIAQQIDQDKNAYWDARQQWQKLESQPVQIRDAKQEKDFSARLDMLSAQIGARYAALDRDWAVWNVDHSTFPGAEPEAVPAIKKQAANWKEHMTLLAEEADDLAAAEKAAFEQEQIESGGGDITLSATVQKLAQLRGAEIEGRSKALAARNKQDRERWQEELARLNPKTDPRDVWVNQVHLHVALADARQTASAAGIAYGEALEAPPASPPAASQPDIASLQKSYAAAAIQVSLIQTRLDLAGVDFEISKRKDMPEDLDLPDLKKQHDALTQKIAQLESAK